MLLGLTVASFATFVVYTLVMVKMFGVPASISDTYYLLERKKKNLGVFFTLALWGMSFLLIGPFIEESKISNTQWLAFIPIAALCFVGSAPKFKSGMERFVHIGATLVCALCSQTWVYIYEPWLLLLWVIPLSWMIYNLSKGNIFKTCNPLFWVEVTAFVVTYIALFIQF